MRGSLREKRPGYWEVRVDAGTDPLTGTRTRIHRGVKGTKRDAEKVLNELIAKNESKKVGGSSTATFESLLTSWLEYASADLAYKTADRYERIIKNQILPVLGPIKLRKLDAMTLDMFYRSLLKGAPKTKDSKERKPLSPGTVRQVHAVIRTALKQGVRWDWIPVNVAEKATPPKQRKTVTGSQEIANVIQLIDRASNSRYPELGLILHLAVVTGARRGELCGLKWVDVKLDERELLISRSVYETAQNDVIEKSTKTHQARRIALDETTIEMLRGQRKYLDDRAAQCGTKLVPDAFMFTDQEAGATPWFPNRVSLSFRRLCVEAKIDGVRFHDLRHFAATQLLTAGVDVRTVSGRLGHANASTTLGTYSHFVNAADQTAAGILGNLITGKAKAKDPAPDKDAEALPE